MTVTIYQMELVNDTYQSLSDVTITLSVRGKNVQRNTIKVKIQRICEH